MHRDSAALYRTLERKQAFVLAADDASFVAEVRGFLRWALADLGLRGQVVGLLEPPEEVARFVEAAPGLVADAGDVVNWMRAKEPQACAQAATAEAWEECDRIVAMAREGSSAEVADLAGYVFGVLNQTRDAMGRAFRDRTDEESVAAWRAAIDLAQSFELRVRERNMAVRVSPGAALLQLVALCGGANAPTEGKHWTDFARGVVGFGAPPLQDLASARVAFRRLVEGLLTAIEGPSGGRAALRRFVERIGSFDAERVSRLAESEGEAALTLELARYLHDAGLPVVIHPHARRGRLPVRVPAIGARAVMSSEGDPDKLLEALRELHGDLVDLDAAGFDVDEGLMAVFVVAGALFELPADIRTARFTIRFETIDLRSADAPDRDAKVRISPQLALAATA